MIYLFGAPPQNQRGQVQLIQPAMTYRWVISAPDKNLARELSKYYQLGLEESQRHGIFYQLYTVPSNDPTPRLLAVEKFIGAAYLRPEAVQGALPQTAPTGQRGMQRLDGGRGTDGFQTHGDEALDPGIDSLYGPPADAGTWSDLIQGHGEVPRE